VREPTEKYGLTVGTKYNCFNLNLKDANYVAFFISAGKVFYKLTDDRTNEFAKSVVFLLTVLNFQHS
jgi:hypothetical protein